MIGRRVDSITAISEPGDYYGPLKGYNGNNVTCYFLLPIARDPGVPRSVCSIQNVGFPLSAYRECKDGSLEIYNVITVYADDGVTCYWQGYLDEGHVWRQC